MKDAIETIYHTEQSFATALLETLKEIASAHTYKSLKYEVVRGPQWSYYYAIDISDFDDNVESSENTLYTGYSERIIIKEDGIYSPQFNAPIVDKYYKKDIKIVAWEIIKYFRKVVQIQTVF